MFTVLPWPSLPYGDEELLHIVVFVVTSAQRTDRVEGRIGDAISVGRRLE